jgi:hypothetical protein
MHDVMRLWCMRGADDFGVSNYLAVIINFMAASSARARKVSQCRMDKCGSAGTIMRVPLHPLKRC